MGLCYVVILDLIANVICPSGLDAFKMIQQSIVCKLYNERGVAGYLEFIHQIGFAQTCVFLQPFIKFCYGSSMHLDNYMCEWSIRLVSWDKP